ncbi:MAG: flagellar biosynthesis protein FlhB [Bdellovibrio sp.]|nr:flagellar biosynthesis protein FlhB [Bdellovibrio sp.]
MAENEERSREDLTEEASPFRVEEYRRKGMVAQSREVSSMVALFAAVVAGYLYAPSFAAQAKDFMESIFRMDFSSKFDLSSGSVMRQVLIKSLLVMASLGLPICIAGFIMGVIGSLAQVGAIFTLEPLQPDFQKINPLAGFKRLVSMKQLYETVRTLVKVVFFLAAAFFLIRSEVIRAPAHAGGDVGYLLSIYGGIAASITFKLLVILAVFAGFDFALQRFEHMKNLRLTKQEAKQEHKEREGDPQIRARIRSVQREMARRRMMEAVKKADVVVTNPTHIAVALSYDREKMAAPKVVAKGADLIAQKIKQIALEAGVPQVENVPLARTLFKSVKVGQAVPRALYQAVAEVLAFVYRLKKRDK